MNYLQSVAYIESLAPTIVNPSLERIAAFMAEHGDLQDKLHSVHIGGTNGKGSTVALVDAVLQVGGLKVGRFTGPHLLRWNERFHVSGQPIADAVFARLCSKLRRLSDDFARRRPEHGHLTWFEFLTALAFFHFAEEGVEIAVIEVGLGGRWDATNILRKPLVSVITSIALDHTHILGNSLKEIALEKAGIIKPAVEVITGSEGDALVEISSKSRQLGAKLITCRAPDVVQGLSIDTVKFKRSLDRLVLQGAYQRENALLAYAIISLCAQKLSLPLVESVDQGFEQVYWPGRFQYLPKHHLLMDGAHNVAGACALRQALDEKYPGGRRIFVLSFFQNKDVLGLVEALVRQGDLVFAAEAATNRAVFPAQSIVSAVNKLDAEAFSCGCIGQALEQALAARRADEIVVASGSFATVKEIMIALGWRKVEDGGKFDRAPVVCD